MYKTYLGPSQLSLMEHFVVDYSSKKAPSHMFQKQPFRGILKKRYSKNLQQLYWNDTSVWVLSCKFAANFQRTFTKNTFEGLLLMFDWVRNTPVTVTNARVALLIEKWFAMWPLYLSFSQGLFFSLNKIEIHSSLYSYLLDLSNTNFKNKIELITF